MHAVVVGRRCGDPAACDDVARLLGRAVVELRRRLAIVGEQPLVIATARDLMAAREAVELLEAHGFEASLVDVRAPLPSFVLVRTFEVHADEIAVVAVDHATSALPWAQVEVIVAGVRARPEPHRALVPVRSLTAADRFVPPVLEREQPGPSPGDEQVLFMVAKDRALVLAEDRLDYRSLGDAVQPSRNANFRHVVQLVRDHCRDAPFDHRLDRPQLRAHILGPVSALDPRLELAATIVSADLRTNARDPYR
jgi:hypothetical protein